MNQQIRNRILNIFNNQSGYARTKDIIQAGIHNIYLKELEKNGIIQKG